LVYTGLGAIAIALLAVAPALAQAPGAAAPGLETIKVRENVYAIFGAGSNITVHVGEDGLILVDSGSTAAAEQVVAAVKAISPQPIRLIINTSADMDHVGGNEVVGAAGLEVNPDSFADEPHATVLSHENVLTRLSGDDKIPTDLWPSETFTSRVRSMYLNNEAVMVYRMTGAHSDALRMVAKTIITDAHAVVQGTREPGNVHRMLLNIANLADKTPGPEPSCLLVPAPLVATVSCPPGVSDHLSRQESAPAGFSLHNAHQGLQCASTV
jgi:hypothetical protein